MKTRTLLFSAILASGLCLKALDSKSDPQNSDLQVTRGKFSVHTLITGTLRATNSVPINTPKGTRSAKITWLAEDGAMVKKGDTVLVIDTAKLMPVLKKAKTAAEKARTDLIGERRNAKINIAAKQYALEQSNFAFAQAKLATDVPVDAFPRRTHEKNRLALTQAISAQTSAREALRIEKLVSRNNIKDKTIAVSSADSDLESVQNAINNFTVVAPQNGLVTIAHDRQTSRPYQVGSVSGIGETIVELPDLSAMMVEATLTDVDDGKIGVDMPVTCVLDAYPQIRIPGRVTAISKVANVHPNQSLRRSFGVQVLLEDTDMRIMRPGLSVRVEVLSASVENAVLIPRRSLSYSETSVTATLATGHQQSITIGPCSFDTCVVLSGIEEGALLSRAAPL